MPGHSRYDGVTEEDTIPYNDLVRVADRILETGEDNPGELARQLDLLDPAVRAAILGSDLLNAFQVFYYFYREEPGDLETDRLILQPASAIATGVLITEREFYEVIFRIEDGEPVISVSDGTEILANFRGDHAYREALRFLDDAL
jgi:hypothetical protein